MLIHNLTDDELWYKDGVIYQVHIKAYKDSNNDGIGDISGVIEKLDYIKSLGANILWLLPFYPSPMKDDGYDIADYYNINPDYGTVEDFKKLLKEAHKKGIKVVTELVLNHTSDQHNWFQKARRSKEGSPERDFYVWSQTPEKYKEARVIFSDFETSNWTWDHSAKAYFWHRFYSHQPDLNFDNPKVHKYMFKVVDYWFEMGVDGLRLDAVPYLYEREGTNCENLPETHQFLKKLNAHIQRKFKNKMLLAEANQWPEDAVAYFGSGDECHMAFHFPLMPRMYMAIQMETRFPIIDILEQTPPIPENCQWAMFLRNHDELTLEMVTDEERDYMYRYYAQDRRARVNLGIRRRLAPLVENNRRKIELLNILLFSFPGTPIIYYGDEIGMGDNYYLGDRNGVRTPMQWSPDKNAGFSNANPQRLFLPVIIDPEYNYEALNVEVQQRNSSSLLWWMKKVISVRKNYKAFGRGSIEFLKPHNIKVLAFYRKYNEETILVVANLSRSSQVVELDLSEFTGSSPIELFSRNKFPVIKEDYYMLTLNAFDYYWFSLVKTSDDVNTGIERIIPQLNLQDGLNTILADNRKEIIEKNILKDYINFKGWGGDDEYKIDSVEITDIIFISKNSDDSILFIKANFIDKLPEFYFLTISSAEGEEAYNFIVDNKDAILFKTGEEEKFKVFLTGVYNEKFRNKLLKLFLAKKNVISLHGEIIFERHKKIKPGKLNQETDSTLIDINPDSISILYNESLLLKIYRKIEPGRNPGEEILHFLNEKTSFKNTLGFLGSIKYKKAYTEPVTLGILTEYVSNQGKAWHYFIDAAGRFYESILSKDKEELKKYNYLNSFIDEETDKENSVCNLIESIYTENAGLLGQRTGELHSALSSSDEDPVFKPEYFTGFYNRSVYQSVRSSIRKLFRELDDTQNQFNDSMKDDILKLKSYENKMLKYIEKILGMKISAKKIRIHGDYHLGQILFTGKDFILTNFEGPSASAFTERKLKRSSLRDIASMIFSFRFAAFTSLLKFNQDKEEYSYLESFADQWWFCMSNTFLNKYYDSVKGTGILPDNDAEFDYLIQIYLLDKMINEMMKHLKNTDLKASIPLKGLLFLSGYYL